MSYKIYVKDVPEKLRIWSYIEQVTNIKRYYNLKPTYNATDLIDLEHTFDINRLRLAVLDAVTKFDPKGWLSKQGRNSGYGGLSLMMNPQYIEPVDPNYHTLGTERNEPTEFFYDHVQKFPTLKNTYFDSYGFRIPSPCVQQTDLINIFNEFSRSQTRGRIAVITSNWDSERRKKGGWHRDEAVFENLRINIPIETDETYLFQIEGKEPVHLSYGNIYSWDTNIPHRVFPTTESLKKRIHVVFGIIPWFDYNAEEDAFISNDFFGNMHPIDMLVEGYVHPSIGLR